MYEVTQRTAYPYSAIAYVTVVWPNGMATRGSGVVVGPNDVLTAMHVVHDSARGGWAKSIVITPGADTLPRLDAPFGTFGNGWSISTRTSEMDSNGDGLVSDSEAQYDLALIGLYERIGDTTGWLGTRSEQLDGLATMAGYPGRGTGLMAETVFADASSRYGVYDIDAGLGAGASGGPLFRTSSSGEVYVVGVASSGNELDTSSTYAALFGPGNWSWLTQAMAANDDLLQGASTGGTAAPTPPAAVAGTGGLVAPKALVQAYLAYFGRPVDAAGISAFADQPAAKVAVAFDASQESRDLYGTQLALKINAIYNNLFNRDAEPVGLQYWIKQAAGAGAGGAPGAALAVLNGAQGLDALAVQNKLVASDAFTRALDTAAEVQGYAGLSAAQVARSFVAGVDGSAVSLSRALLQVDSAVAQAVAAGRAKPASFDVATALDADAGLALGVVGLLPFESAGWL